MKKNYTQKNAHKFKKSTKTKIGVAVAEDKFAKEGRFGKPLKICNKMVSHRKLRGFIDVVDILCGVLAMVLFLGIIYMASFIAIPLEYCSESYHMPSPIMEANEMMSEAVVFPIETRSHDFEFAQVQVKIDRPHPFLHVFYYANKIEATESENRTHRWGKLKVLANSCRTVPSNYDEWSARHYKFVEAWMVPNKENIALFFCEARQQCIFHKETLHQIRFWITASIFCARDKACDTKTFIDTC